MFICGKVLHISIDIFEQPLSTICTQSTRVHYDAANPFCYSYLYMNGVSFHQEVPSPVMFSEASAGDGHKEILICFMLN